MCVFVYGNQQNRYSNTFKKKLIRGIKKAKKGNLIEKTITTGKYKKNANTCQSTFLIY